MIERGEGSLLDADAEALVNEVNCKGVMGKGIALQFKLAYPENFDQYKQACDAGSVRLGEVLVVPTGSKDNPLYIVNSPTKYHWRDRSPLIV
jgi:O-acetyl-ADP-ribose deacetylase (regulator of RNase III)